MHRTEEYVIPYRRILTTAVLIVILLAVCAALAVPPASSGTGSAVVGNPTPTITSRTISDTVDGGNQTSARTVNTYYFFWFAVSDDNTLNDIKNITITLYDTSGTSGIFDKEHSYGFSWQNASGSIDWYELTALGWDNDPLTYLNDTDSVQPTLSSDSGTWKFNAAMAKVASNVGSPAWTFKAEVIDSADQSVSTTGGAVWFDFSYYEEYTLHGSAVSWTSLNPGATNSTATTPGDGDNHVTITAINHASHIQVEGDGALARTGGGGTSFPLANVYVGQTGSAVTNDGKKLTTEFQTLWSAIDAGLESTEKAAYYFITVPDPCISGTYTFTWTVQIVTT